MRPVPSRQAWLAALAAAATLALFARPAAAQIWMGTPVPRAGSVELGGGVLWAQGYDLGGTPAELTRNPTTGSSPLQLFDSTSRLDPASGLVARLGVYLSRSVSLEGGFQFSKPVLGVRVSGDFEGADAATVTETISRYVFDGSVVIHLLPASFAGGRGVPFLTGGGGYVRELHEGNELVETGQQYHVGGGLKFWFGERRRRFGIRGDVGIAVREGASDFSESWRTVPTAGASLLYLF
jgi:hypothetical protein